MAIFGCKKGIPIYTANRLQRRATNLLAYSFNIEYINTDAFSYVDFLSRLIEFQQNDDDEYVIASIKLENQLLAVINSNAELMPIKFSQLRKIYDLDEQLLKLKSNILNNWIDLSFKSDPYLSKFYNRRELCISNNIILFGERIVIPFKLRKCILKELHKGHPGIFRMKNLARSYVYWPNIDKDIENTVKICSKCALAGKSPIKTLLHSWPLPNGPWERIHIDYAGPFKNSNFLVVVDAFSKWPEIIRTDNTTAAQTIKILSSIFSRFGPPLQIVSDNGRQFIAESFQAFCNINGIELTTTSPYHPSSNGQAERFVDTFKRAMHKLEGEGNIDEILDIFLRTYRCTPNIQCENQKSPAEMMFNRKIRTTFDLLKPRQNDTTINRNIDMESKFNFKHGAKEKSFDIDVPIYVQIHKNNKWRWKEGIIVDKIGNVNYKVSTDERILNAHSNQLNKRFIDEKPEDQLPLSTLLDIFQLRENLNGEDVVVS